MDLPAPGDPFHHPFGTVATPLPLKNDTALNAEPIETRNVLPLFSKYAPIKEITLDQTPEKDAKQQLAISAVVALRLMGLSFVDIASMFNVTLAEVEKICQLQSTQQTFERLYRALINSSAENIQGRIASYAHRAVDVVVNLMESDKAPDIVKLKAAQDVLDRSGANAEQFFTAKDDYAGQGDELRIVMMDDEGQTEKLNITLTRK